MTEHGDTKARILDTAERLFAEQGYAETSMRCITSGAGVNLASVNYHFGSKEALLLEVIARRIGPVNEARMILLDKIDAEARGKHRNWKVSFAPFFFRRSRPSTKRGSRARCSCGS